MNMAYSINRHWSDQFIPEIRRIVGAHLLSVAPDHIDMRQVADLLMLDGRDVRTAARVRRHGYAGRYPMAQKGRAADAVGIALSSSALGGLFGGVVPILFAPLLARFASGFAPPEFAALALTGLITIAVISDGPLIKGLLAGAFGLLIATIGTDEFSTGYRFTFGSYHMLDGFHIVAVVVGLFAISEMVFQFVGGHLLERQRIEVVRPGFGSILMTLRHWENLLRSSAIGAFFGALPGAGGVISSFAAYAAAKAAARREERYGEGAEGGVVATESANNSTVGGTLVPSLALGIPGDASSAVLIGSLLILGFFSRSDTVRAAARNRRRHHPRASSGKQFAACPANIAGRILDFPRLSRRS